MIKIHKTYIVLRYESTIFSYGQLYAILHCGYLHLCYKNSCTNGMLISMYQKIFSLSTGFEMMNNQDIYIHMIYKYNMNIHSFTFDIHFCFAIDLSLKKNPNEIFVEILFNLKIIAIQNWNQSYTYILLIFTAFKKWHFNFLSYIKYIHHKEYLHLICFDMV